MKENGFILQYSQLYGLLKSYPIFLTCKCEIVIEQRLWNELDFKYSYLIGMVDTY